MRIIILGKISLDEDEKNEMIDGNVDISEFSNYVKTDP
jgi:hypothetical protein